MNKFLTSKKINIKILVKKEMKKLLIVINNFKFFTNLIFFFCNFFKLYLFKK
jgi:hypothetical protein